MARKQKEFLPIEDISRMKAADVRAALLDIQKTANRRIRRLREQEDVSSSPAYRQVMESGGRIKVGGMNRNQMIAEYKRAKTFLTSKTSTISGTRQYYQNIKESFENAGIQIEGGIKEIDNFLQAFDKLKEQSPQVANRAYKYQIMSALNEQIAEGGTLTDAINAVESELDDLTYDADNGDFFMDFDEDAPWI